LSDILPFDWEQNYYSIGGRTLNIPKVREIANKIKDEQLIFDFIAAGPNPVNFNSDKEASDIIINKSLALGADVAGIATIDVNDIYKGRTLNGKYAIVLGKKMKKSEFEQVPSDSSAIECMNVYHTLGKVIIDLANFISTLGYDCTIQHPMDKMDVLFGRLAMKAGIGELGRHGCIINPQLGSLFRLGDVITSRPLEANKPIDFGISEFCDKCKICIKACPAGAIPAIRNEEQKELNGRGRYIINGTKCFEHFARNKYCSICISACPYTSLRKLD